MYKENTFVTFATSGLAMLLSSVMALYSCAWGEPQGKNVSTGSNAKAETFERISEAKIDFAGGMPRLLINGEPVLPLIFFFNTAGGMHEGQGNLEPQAKLSAGAGVHIYSMPFVDWPWIGDGTDFSKSDHVLDRFIEVDPQAMFILRIWSEPPGSWSGWGNAPHEKEGILHADGSRWAVSVASDFFWEKFKESLVRLIHRYEASPYGKRILGYHIGGQNTTEWFHQDYREKGPDYNEVNQRRFRSWLTAKYKTDEVLAAAWGDGKVTLETARIPLWASGRFPIRSVSVSKGRKLEAFYQLPAERDWVDFSSYATDIIAERIIDVSKLIKKETQGRKLTSFFYGYTFDLCASMSGHNAMHRILKCPAIDLLCSPISYIPMKERVAGGLAGYMTAVDSVGAHGKIWINEDDLPTYLVDPKKRPSWLPEGMLKHRTKGLEDTLGVLGRNLSTVFVHRAGTWWMDLIAEGAFNDARLWRMLEERSRLYRQVYEHPTPYRPEVAVIVDERSVFYVKSDWDVFCSTLPLLRNACGKSGASVGYYYLDDFIEGVVPPCKAYVFANTFYLADAQIEAIHSRLDREGTMAIWQYAPGFMGPSGADVNRCSKVTGIRLAVRDGSLGSRGEADFDGLTWGWAAENMVSPRLIVEDQKAKPLGRYVDGWKVSAARARVGEHSSVFIGDFNLNPELLARLFEEAGAHIWTKNSEVIHTDGNILVVHSGEAGIRTIFVPAGMDVDLIAPETVIAREKDKMFVEFTAEGQSYWFRILPKR